MARTALIWDDALAEYRFRPGHPLNPRRLELTVSLIRALELAGDPERPIIPPRDASDDELAWVHTPEYMAAVAAVSASGEPAAVADPLRYGLGTEDVPVVPNMHARARGVVGATLTAAELVMSGRATRAFNPAGGLHHAGRARAAGFCVYNDLAVAIEWARREHGARVLYLDIDAHHGDGVQDVFYADPDVLTVSLHESGLYLFPASGFVEELGTGEGHGYSANMPFAPHTEDASYLAAFDMLVPDMAAAFRPDVIVMQCGCDAHAWDPLTHMRCTTSLFEQLVQRVVRLADEHCGGRIIATGGGGYAVHEVVPRAWTLVWGALAGSPAPDRVPAGWLREVREESGLPVPEPLRDPPGSVPPAPRREEITAENDRTARSLKRRIMPLLTGWGLGF